MLLDVREALPSCVVDRACESELRARPACSAGRSKFGSGQLLDTVFGFLMYGTCKFLYVMLVLLSLILGVSEYVCVCACIASVWM
jgi:hypothetical protein